MTNCPHPSNEDALTVSYLLGVEQGKDKMKAGILALIPKKKEIKTGEKITMYNWGYSDAIQDVISGLGASIDRK